MDRTPRSVNAIVESQVQRWLAERPGKSDSYRPPPVITVSREYGARGGAMARLVAEKLGFSYWNRELLAAIAAHARVDPSVMAPFDEHHPSAIVDTMRGFMPTGASASQADYARELRVVVGDIVSRGGAVLVGRGVGFLVDGTRALRVRVVCPLTQRIQELARREGVTAAEARVMIDDNDRDRRAYVRDLFGKEVDDVAAYDLWVSTAGLSLEAGAEVIAAGFRGKFGPEATTRTASAT
jgi:cytidylate kinase